MGSKNLRSRFSVVRQQSSALSKIWIAVLKVLSVIVCSCSFAYMQYANSNIDAAFAGHAMGYCLTKKVLSREYINQPTGHDAKIGQQTGPYAIIKLSEILEETKISVQGRTDVKMLVRYQEGSHGTAPPRVLGTRVRTRSGAGSSAQAPRISMEKAFEVPGNARPSKRRWEQESSLATRDNQTKSKYYFRCASFVLTYSRL